MNDPLSQSLKAGLSEKLADSLKAPLPEATSRRVFGAVQLPGKATAVVGMRRAGKTTFLHQLRRERHERGIARERLPYINFEDERLVGLTATHLSFLVEEHYRLFPALRGRETVTWFFDEIQHVPGWERFVRRLLDSEQVEVFVTGSSSALLSREIATALRGRAWEVVMHPFSFEESLRHQGRELPSRPDFVSGPERSRLERGILDWLKVGGFPEVQGVDAVTRHQLLRDYVDVAMLRDVVERHRVSNVVGLRWMVRHLLGNAAAMFSVEKFFLTLKSQGLAISRDTVHQLLAHLEDCFLVRTVWMESTSERQRMVNPRKTYPVDPGLIPVFDRSGRANLGHALETAVLIELERRRLEITYVRTPDGYEVDFLTRTPESDMELIQVAAELADTGTIEREARALKGAEKVFPHARKRLLTLTREAIPAQTPADITVQPAWEWLLTLPATG